VYYRFLYSRVERAVWCRDSSSSDLPVSGPQFLMEDAKELPEEPGVFRIGTRAYYTANLRKRFTKMCKDPVKHAFIERGDWDAEPTDTIYEAMAISKLYNSGWDDDVVH